MRISETRSERTKCKRKKNWKKIICLMVIIAVLGGVLAMGTSYVLAYLAEDTATTYVDKASGLTEELSTQQDIDTALGAWSAAVDLVNELKEGAARDSLTQSLAEIRKTIADGQQALDVATAKLAAEETATQAVESAQAASENLTTQQQIDSAFAQHENASTIVEDLHEGPVKEELIEVLAALENQLVEALAYFDAQESARVAVDKADDLTANLSSQSLVNKAKAAHETASKQVEALPDGETKDLLSEQLAEIIAEIDVAQQELYRKAEEAATEAVEKAESRIDKLSTQGAINSSDSAYRSANRLVSSLHSGSVKSTLTTRIKAVKSAINQAQKKLDDRWAEVRLNFSRSRYTYHNLAQDVQKLVGHYPELAQSAVVGQSVEGRNIWSITIGKGSKNILILGSVHASEWISTPVLMRTAETLLWDYGQDLVVDGEPVENFLNQYSITFIPMVNPDGVTLVQQGKAAYPEREEELLALNEKYGDDFSRWKANICGVDINRNFDVNWADQPGQEQTDPNFAFYPGPTAESEPETRAVAKWVRTNNPEMLLDYHSYGNILYWWYLQKGSQRTRDANIVKAMRSYSGYQMESIDQNANPSATTTYWGSYKIGIPSITVELGSRPPNHLGMSDVSSIFNRVRYLPLIAIKNLPGY